MDNMHRQDLAYLGECYVALELAKKGFRVQRVSGNGFYFDFLGENGCKIEVKTALPSMKHKIVRGKDYEYKNWQFRFSDPLQKSSDFYIYVALENMKHPPLGFFVIPKKEVTTREKSGMIALYESDLSGVVKKDNKIRRNIFLNNWEQVMLWKGFTK